MIHFCDVVHSHPSTYQFDIGFTTPKFLLPNVGEIVESPCSEKKGKPDTNNKQSEEDYAPIFVKWDYNGSIFWLIFHSFDYLDNFLVHLILILLVFSCL